MSKTIHSILPDGEALLKLEPEEVAGIVLEYLNSLSDSERGQLHRTNFSLQHTYIEFPSELHSEIAKVLMEGWVWLEREGLIAPRPGETGEWVFITRRGKKMKAASDLEGYRHCNLLPRKQLHPVIASKVWTTFIRGDYDTAVFQAFKEVEVSVRNAGGFPPEEIGVNLMRKAFSPGKGPLSDKSKPIAEQEALSSLVAGAIGSYKNPHSHRSVTIDAEEAVEMIIIASHLLKIVDSAVSTTPTT